MKDPVDREIGRMTRRSLLTGAVATLAGVGAWEWLRSRRPDDEVAWPVRLGLRANEQLARDYFRETRLARTFAPSGVESLPTNGDIRIADDLDPDGELRVPRIAGSAEPLMLTLDQVK